ENPVAEFLFGRLESNTSGSPNRIAFIPTSETFSGPGGIGGYEINGTRQNAILTRQVNFEIHVWSNTMENTETLYRNLVVILYRCNSLFSLSLGEATWETQDEDSSGYAVNG